MIKIKICFFLSHLPQGGAERQTLLLIYELLKTKKFEITLVLYNNCPLIFYKEVFDIPVKLIINNKKQRNKLLSLFSKIRFIKSFYNHSEFDVIHTLLPHNGFLIRLLAPRNYKNRILYSVRNNLKDSSVFYKLSEKYLIKNSIVVTNSVQSQMQFINLVGYKFSNNVFNIYNGFDTEKFASQSLPVLKSEVTIGTIGRQTKQKNQDQILRVLPKLVCKFKFHFYLIGDKTLDKASKIEQIIFENNLTNIVTILDSQPHIETFYKKFNIFVLSSLYEGCPNVLFEALLSRCLCIISDGANSDNFIKDGYNGLVYDGTDTMLEQKMIEAFEILNNKILLSKITENGYSYAVENFSLKKMTSQYLGLYEKMNNQI